MKLLSLGAIFFFEDESGNPYTVAFPEKVEGAGDEIEVSFRRGGDDLGSATYKVTRYSKAQALRALTDFLKNQ